MNPQHLHTVFQWSTGEESNSLGLLEPFVVWKRASNFPFRYSIGLRRQRFTLFPLPSRLTNLFMLWMLLLGYPQWYSDLGSNQGPTRYQHVALPTELSKYIRLSLKTTPPQAAVSVNLIAEVLSKVIQSKLAETRLNFTKSQRCPSVKWYSEVGSNHQPDDYKSSVLTD